MTWAIRVRQALLIARLELSRAFFSKRVLWVYLLAVAMCVPFVGRGIEVKSRRARFGDRIAPAEKIEALREGQTIEEVRASLGRPAREETWVNWEDKQRRVEMQFFDGEKGLTFVTFRAGVLTDITTRPMFEFEEDRQIHATIFQVFYLRLAIFFGCLGIFLNLFRGAMMDKTLHYWLLTPVRREVLVVGKYLAGVTASGVIFGGFAALSFYSTLWYQRPEETAAYWAGPGPSHLFWYVVAAVAGCVGYGGLFLAAGVLVRNPILPAVVLLLWEAANPFLPSSLQHVSVLYYLQSLCPIPRIPLDDDAPGLLKLLFSPAEPVTALGAILGILAVTLCVLWIAARAARRLELNYGAD